MRFLDLKQKIRVINESLNMLAVVIMGLSVSHALLVALGQMAQCNATRKLMGFTDRVLLTLACTL
jgi:hypothetical protein